MQLVESFLAEGEGAFASVDLEVVLHLPPRRNPIPFDRTGSAMQTVRYLRWAGDRTLADRLVLVLHVAYAFVPIGFFLMGAAVLWPAIFPTSAGFHAWMAGAIGLMTLAVMTRASLGHTGQELTASLPTQLIYLCAFIAALSRIIAAFEPSRVLLHVAATSTVR